MSMQYWDNIPNVKRRPHQPMASKLRSWNITWRKTAIFPKFLHFHGIIITRQIESFYVPGIRELHENEAAIRLSKGQVQFGRTMANFLSASVRQRQFSWNGKSSSPYQQVEQNDKRRDFRKRLCWKLISPFKERLLWIFL